MPVSKKKYYAYALLSGERGITDNWAECEKIVSGKFGARYRGFKSRDEAAEWLTAGARYKSKPAPRLEKGVYFDAGTGRGEGVEISVTDEHGRNLLHTALSKRDMNRFGKHLIKNDEATNNYGELFALRYALQVAAKTRVKKIFGDSKLVIDYWSKWHTKRKALPKATVKLADEVAALREKFEKKGGTVEKISGDHNPADLGFH